ncbi:MAG: hypothetical protein WD688_04175 [Candidatus Binatia bacterium]
MRPAYSIDGGGARNRDQQARRRRPAPLQNIEALWPRLGFVAALQFRHVARFLVHVQSILHGAYAAHGGHFRDQLIHFIAARRTAQGHPAGIDLHVNGRWIAHDVAKLCPYSFPEHFIIDVGLK